MSAIALWERGNIHGQNYSLIIITQQSLGLEIFVQAEILLEYGGRGPMNRDKSTHSDLIKSGLCFGLETLQHSRAKTNIIPAGYALINPL